MTIAALNPAKSPDATKIFVIPSQELPISLLVPLIFGWTRNIFGFVLSHDIQMITGWWLSPTPLKNDGLKVSWDDDIPN